MCVADASNAVLAPSESAGSGVLVVEVYMYNLVRQVSTFR